MSKITSEDLSSTTTIATCDSSSIATCDSSSIATCDSSSAIATCDSSSNNATERYYDIPYNRIVEALLRQQQIFGIPEFGERNTVFLSVAIHMRYILNFDEQAMLRNLPEWELSEQERLKIIRTAISKPRKTDMPLVLNTAITECRAYKQCEEGMGMQKQDLNFEMPAQMPRLFNILCNRLPEDFRPAMIIAALPVLGALATDIRFKYLDGQTQSLSFMSCIIAPAASGKSFMRKPIALLLKPIDEQDAIERQKDMKYREQLRAAKNSKQQPENPHACTRNNGVNISVSRLLQLLAFSGGKHLIGISEEMDSLIKSERAGTWSQKSDIYRLAFDNADYGQAYISSESVSEKVKIYYNLLLSGTPDVVTKFYSRDNLENGLMTRTAFATIPNNDFAQMPVFPDFTAAEEKYIIDTARKLQLQNGVIKCAAVQKSIDEWLEQKRQFAICDASRAADMLRRRAAVIGFRAGMIAYLLEDRCGHAWIGEFATWVAEFIFRHQMWLFGDQLENALSTELYSGKGHATALLYLLPQTFNMQDLIAARIHNGQSIKRSSLTMLITRWTQAGMITRVAPDQYRRIKAFC